MKKQKPNIKTIGLSTEIVEKIKAYCSIRRLKIKEWAEQALIKTMKENK